MNDFQVWARRWRVPAEGMAELARMLEYSPNLPASPDPHTEEATQQAIRLAAPRLGASLWRNNVGALKDDGGRWVRYGLANDSPRVNKQTKSGDLIGVCPCTVTSAHVGRTLGVFVSVECKRANWRWAGTERETAQRHWATLVQLRGGVAGFARNVEDFNAILMGGRA
jgi:hypothetical protein